MMNARMRRRLKRRGKTVDQQDANNDDDKISVSSPPRLRRDSTNKISSSTREFTFNLEEAGAPIIDTTDDFGGGTISTVTNDVAFRENAFRCGFDSAEYSVMQQQQQSQLLTKKDETTYLQLQTDGEEFRSSKGSSTKKTQESPMGVNELDFPDQQFEWADFDSNNAKQGPSSAKLNLGRNLKKDDDSFFYSASAPSSEGTNDTKLVGETITLGSTSSYLHSCDILDNGRKAETEQGSRRVDTRQLGMGRGSPIRQQPSPRDSSLTGQTKEVHTAAAAAAAPPSPPPPPQAPRQRSKNPKEDVSNNDDSTKPGCAVPDIVQEFVDDVKSVLSQVISVAYLACSEGEQCLSRCQSDEPETKPQPSQLNTIVEDSTVPPPNPPSVVRGDESKRFKKPWAGDYLCHRTGTEETADNSSQEAEGTAVKKHQGSRTNRLRKFLTSFKTRRQ
eukprot:scaffold41101_cov150-Skeletonema_dohrnii-CCMP3373.AAC.3